MMQKERLERLVQLAAAISDRKLGAYHEATARCAETRALMQALDVPPASDLPLVAAAQAQLVYGVWADRRRAQLREVLEQQLAEATKRRTEAAQAFGKSQVLNQVSGQPVV
jgi:hypothetical protein